MRSCAACHDSEPCGACRRLDMMTAHKMPGALPVAGDLFPEDLARDERRALGLLFAEE